MRDMFRGSGRMFRRRLSSSRRLDMFAGCCQRGCRMFCMSSTLVNNRFESAFENVYIAAAEHRTDRVRNADQTADRREDRQDDQGYGHVCRRFMRMKILWQSVMFFILIVIFVVAGGSMVGFVTDGLAL